MQQLKFGRVVFDFKNLLRFPPFSGTVENIKCYGYLGYYQTDLKQMFSMNDDASTGIVAENVCRLSFLYPR